MNVPDPLNDLKDLREHKFISYVDELVEFPELNYFDEINDSIFSIKYTYQFDVL